MKTFLLSSFFRKHNSHEFAGIVWIPGCTNKMLVTKMRGKKRKKILIHYYQLSKGNYKRWDEICSIKQSYCHKMNHNYKATSKAIMCYKHVEDWLIKWTRVGYSNVMQVSNPHEQKICSTLKQKKLLETKLNCLKGNIRNSSTLATSPPWKNYGTFQEV